MADMDISITNPPPDSNLALAFAILKHKPEDKTVQEYILELRKFIRKADDPGSFRSGEIDKFFDGITFWKKAHEASDAEKTKLHNKIYELEQRNNNTLDNLNIDSIVHGVLAKRLSTDANLDELQKGKKKRSKGKKAPEVPIDMEVSTTDPTRLLRQVLTLQSAMQKKRRSKAIITDAVILCKIAELELLESVQRFIQPANPDNNPSTIEEPSLPTVIKAVGMSFQLVQQAMKKINGLKDEKKGIAQITYYLVCLFESSMIALTQLCTAISKRIPASLENNKTSEQQHQTSHEEEIAQQLVDLLVTMVVALELKQHEDQELIEGFLAVALSRVGKLLALFVFEGLKQSTDLPPDGLIAMRQEDLSPQEAKLEATHLLAFMERTLGDGSRLLSHPKLSGSPFFRMIKERLQKTLMQAVFGNDDTLFRQGGLDRPSTPPAQGPGSHQTSKKQFPDFFTQELWRLVGWDILRSAFEP